MIVWSIDDLGMLRVLSLSRPDCFIYRERRVERLSLEIMRWSLLTLI